MCLPVLQPIKLWICHQTAHVSLLVVTQLSHIWSNINQLNLLIQEKTAHLILGYLFLALYFIDTSRLHFSVLLYLVTLFCNYVFYFLCSPFSYCCLTELSFGLLLHPSYSSYSCPLLSFYFFFFSLLFFFLPCSVCFRFSSHPPCWLLPFLW